MLIFSFFAATGKYLGICRINFSLLGPNSLVYDVFYTSLLKEKKSSTYNSIDRIEVILVKILKIAIFKRFESSILKLLNNKEMSKY